MFLVKEFIDMETGRKSFREKKWSLKKKKGGVVSHRGGLSLRDPMHSAGVDRIPVSS